MTGIRARLTLAVTALFGVALLFGAWFLVRAVERTVINSVEHAQTERLELLRRQVERGVPLAALQVPPAPANMKFEVRRFGNEPLDLPDAPPLPNAAPLPVTPQILPQAIPALKLDSAPGEVHWAISRLPSTSPSEGRVTLVAASPLDDIRGSVEALRRILAWCIPAMVAAIAGGAWWVTGRALKPVLAMTQRVEGITGSTLHERLPVPASRDEVARLARTMNAMLDRLERAARRQREFISDASHELRSPVASIRTQLEVALAHPDADRWPAIAQGVLEEGARLEKLVADLLLLARLDEASDRAQEDVDLDDVVLEQSARSWRLPVHVHGVHAARIAGDRAQVSCIVRNLIENAARHGKTRVEVATRIKRGTIHLTVDDDGEGIPTEHRRHVFERFTRLEEARSRDGGGAGLGLSMVRRIVELHGGRVRIEESPLGGARVAATFSAAKMT